MNKFKAPKTLEMLSSFILPPGGEETPTNVGFEFFSLSLEKKNELRELASMLENEGVTPNFAQDISMKMFRSSATRRTLGKICDSLTDEICAQARKAR